MTPARASLLDISVLPLDLVSCAPLISHDFRKPRQPLALARFRWRSGEGREGAAARSRRPEKNLKNFNNSERLFETGKFAGWEILRRTLSGRQLK